MKPSSKTIAGRRTSDFIRNSLSACLVPVTCRYGRRFDRQGFLGRGPHARVSVAYNNLGGCNFLSLFHFLEKRDKVPWGCDLRLVRSWDNYSHFRSIVLFSIWFGQP